MTFSFRELLALLLVIGLGLLAWRTQRAARHDQAALAALRSELQELEALTAVGQPDVHQALLAEQDERDLLRSERQTAEEAFARIRDKYGALAPPSPGELALRRVPSLPVDDETPIVFRLSVPEDRPVWLCFGVRPGTPNVQRSATPSELVKSLLRESPSSVTGPLETQLTPGEHLLTFARGRLSDDQQSLWVELDERKLLETTFQSVGLEKTGITSISAMDQLNFGAQHSLPWLATTSLQVKSDAASTEAGKAYELLVWLSDQAQGFEPFPAGPSPPAASDSEERP